MRWFSQPVTLLSFLIVSLPLFGQQTLLHGQVYDAATKEALEGAVVKTIHGHQIVQAGKGGSFFLSGRPDSILVSFSGYHPQKLSAKNDTLITVYLQKAILQLKDVTILSGNRLDTYKILSGIDLNLQPVKSAQDLLRLVPGLFIAQHMGGGKAEQIFLRGFDADHGTDINICVDGIPVNMVTHAHGQGYADMHFVIPETIASYDFGKGPYYSEKGDFTTAGFVSYTTRSSLSEDMIRVEAGRFNSYRSMALINLFNTLDKPNGQSAYIAAESLYSNGGPYELGEHFNRFNLFGKYVKKLSANSILMATASIFHSQWRSSGEIPDRAASEGYVINRFGVIDSAQGGKTNRSNISIRLCNDLKNNWSLENEVYASYYDFNLVSNFTFFYYFPSQGDEFRQLEKRFLAGYNGKATRIAHTSTLTFTTDLGWGGRFDHVYPLEMDHTQEGVFLAHFRLDKAKEINTNFWVNETLKVGRWMFNGGIRIDRFYFNDQNLLPADTAAGSGTVNKTVVSPKLNIAYDVNDRLQIYFKSGKGFHSNDARVVIANSGLDILPAAYGVDLGVNLKPVKNVYINAALWYLYLKQEFVFGQDLSDQLNGPVSPSGRTVRVGADVSVRYQINSWLFANLNGNLARPRYLDSLKGHDYVELAPTFTSTAALDFHLTNGLYGGISYRYLHGRPGNSDNSLTASGYFIADAAINYRHKNYEMGLSVENLFNAAWNESQVAYTARLKNEPQAVEQISYTPGVPFFPKLKFAVFFK